MRLFTLIFELGVLAIPVLAQNPDDLSFALATKSANTTFRVGEEVDVEFRFASRIPGRYEVAPCYSTRRFVGTSPDVFVVEPGSGTADPLVDIPAQIAGGGSCLVGSPLFLDAKPIVRDRILNEWVDFQRPGRFRITATTNQIVDSQSNVRLRLQSNTLEIDIAAPEAGWAEAQAQQAIAVLKASSSDDEVVRAGKTLRFLQTAEAAPALVEFFAKSFRAGPDLRLGLFSSPYRKEILSRLEADLLSPDVPISQSWFNTLVELATVAITGPRPKPPVTADQQASLQWKAAENAYVAQFKPVQDRYLAAISNAVTRKRGQARAITLQTLLLSGPQPPAESIRRAVIDSFGELPEGNQTNLLNGYWTQWASEDAHPAVLSVARGTAATRNDALIRLLEFSVDEARQIVIDRVRKGDYAVVYGNFPRALLMLPDKTLPELDDVLASAYEEGRPVDRLIARYATERVYARIRTAHEKRIASCGEILPYFFRVDPETAAGIRKAASQTSGAVCPLVFDWPVARSPGLEQAAIEDLASSDPRLVVPALALLERGSVNAKEALWKAIERAKADKDTVSAVIRTLLKPGDWFLTSEELDRLKSACPDRSCQADVASTTPSLRSPVTIGLDGPIRIGPYEVSTREEIVHVIRQFPSGTKFRLQETSRIGLWVYQKRLDEVNAALAIAGIDLLEKRQQ